MGIGQEGEIEKEHGYEELHKDPSGVAGLVLPMVLEFKK